MQPLIWENALLPRAHSFNFGGVSNMFYDANYFWFFAMPVSSSNVAHGLASAGHCPPMYRHDLSLSWWYMGYITQFKNLQILTSKFSQIDW